MIKIKGKPVSEGAAFGKIAFSGRHSRVVRRYRIKDIRAEKARFERIAEKLTAELEQGGEREKEYALILTDPDFYNTVTGIIASQQVNAEFAAALAGNSLFDLFDNSDNEYMRSRAGDILSAADLLIDKLNGRNTDSEDVIVCTENTDGIPRDDGRIKAVVSSSDNIGAEGGIPTIACAEDIFKYDIEGKYAAADGFSGILYIEPDKATEDTLSRQSRLFEERKALAKKLEDRRCINPDGIEIKLYAEAFAPEEITKARKNQAEGIGILRTDGLYGGKHLPSEDFQFSYYKAALEKAEGKELTVCTFDVNADAAPECALTEKENDPSLGFRSTRIALDRSEILKTQLRALYRASYYGKLSILIPMITLAEEFSKIRKMSEDVKKELREEKIPFGRDIPLGAAIETPAAALISGRLAEAADIIVINTTLLTKYTLAADPQNKRLSGFFKNVHPSVIRLVAKSVENAKKFGKKTEISGILAENTELAEFFLTLGVDILTVRPEYILPLKEKICSLAVSERREEITKKYLGKRD